MKGSGSRKHATRDARLLDHYRKTGKIDQEFLARNGWNAEDVRGLVTRLRQTLGTSGRRPWLPTNQGAGSTATGPISGGQGLGGAARLPGGTQSGPDQRMKLRQKQLESVSPEYRKLLEAYFRKLAERN